MDTDGYRKRRRQSCRSVEDELEIVRLEACGSELQAEYERLYTDYKNLHSQHKEAVMNAKILERKHSQMDSRAYRKQWRTFYEEEIASQELGVTIRQYAEGLRNQKNEIIQTRNRLMKEGNPC